MGLFKPIWKTEDKSKLKKAADSVRRIRSRDKLNEIALSAPLGGVKIAALGRLRRITNGSYQPDEATRMKQLLSIDVEWLYGHQSDLVWYVQQLEKGLPDDKKVELVQKASNSFVRENALEWISDPECLIRLGGMPELPDKLLEGVALQVDIKTGRTMEEIFEDEALPQPLRSAAGRKLAAAAEQREREDRRRRELAEKREACKKAGHKWKFIKLTYKTSGMSAGREVLYRCENCGEEWRNFIEGNTDSV